RVGMSSVLPDRAQILGTGVAAVIAILLQTIVSLRTTLAECDLAARVGSVLGERGDLEECQAGADGLEPDHARLLGKLDDAAGLDLPQLVTDGGPRIP